MISLFIQGQENKTSINEGIGPTNSLSLLDFLLQKLKHICLSFVHPTIGWLVYLTPHHLKESFVFPSISHP